MFNIFLKLSDLFLKPHTIVFLGKTGVGKTTTINHLFDLDWNTDNVVACTKKPQVANIYIVNNDYKYKIRVVDLPGIGESIEEDLRYMKFYRQWVAQANTIVWITQADTRAYKRDQIFLKKLLGLCSSSISIILALNKIDCLEVKKNQEPFNFNTCLPSVDQKKMIQEKIEDIYQVFSNVISPKILFNKDQIIAYTCIYNWGLNDLKIKLLKSKRKQSSRICLNL